MYYHGVVVVFVFVQISDAIFVSWQLVACLLLDSIVISYFLSLLVCLYNSYLFVVLWLDSSFFVIVCVDRCCWSCADSVSRICFVWVAVAQLASICPVSYFFPETSGSMGLLFITRWALHPSLSNQLKCYKDSIKYQMHQWMPHSSSVAKQNEYISFFVPGFHSLWVRDHSKWTKQWQLRMPWTANRKQLSRSHNCLSFRKKIDC